MKDDRRPCQYGHFDCSGFDGGPCSDESRAAIIQRCTCGLSQCYVQTHSRGIQPHREKDCPHFASRDEAVRWIADVQDGMFEPSVDVEFLG